MAAEAQSRMESETARERTKTAVKSEEDAERKQDVKQDGKIAGVIKKPEGQTRKLRGFEEKKEMHKEASGYSMKPQHEEKMRYLFRMKWLTIVLGF